MKCKLIGDGQVYIISNERSPGQNSLAVMVWDMENHLSLMTNQINSVCDHPLLPQCTQQIYIVQWVVGSILQCSTTGVTKAVVCVILFVGWCI